ncbi:S41 family peptidase [Inmirania thermothiophila]|nr:S41 family peptidase [Inmirania thermothiophila]
MRQLSLILLGTVLGIALLEGGSALAERGGEGAAAVPLEELRLFSEVYARLKSDYVEPVDDRTLLENAIRGMLAGLDPHSAYLDEDAFRELRIGTSGEFGGLGIEVTMEGGFVKVIAPIDDTPAERAGIRAGDLIIRLDDTPVKGMTLAEAVKRMRGKPGTQITLTVVREGEEKPLKFTITRDVIRVRSVRSRLLEDGFGYVRISHFQAQTARALREAVSALRKQAGGNLKGLILDLRNNPGGVLNAAVEVSDAFLRDGLIVYTDGRVEDAKLRFNATPDDILNGAPMVVLVNGGSASASEIVAGALKDHRRAIVMGQKTFGKGSVQTIVPLANETAIKFTTARYFTPSGRSIQAEGIVPDIRLDNVKVTRAEDNAIEPVKEADLSRHLANPNGDAKAPQEEAPAGGASVSATEDYALYEALNLLRGLAILQARGH